jgi:hypothetical protein
MGLLSAEIANESSPAHVRQSAALALKNQLTAKVINFRKAIANDRTKRDEMNIKRNGLV